MPLFSATSSVAFCASPADILRHVSARSDIAPPITQDAAFYRYELHSSRASWFKGMLAVVQGMSDKLELLQGMSEATDASPDATDASPDASDVFDVIEVSERSQIPFYYPIYAITASNCLALDRFETHETLLAKKLLVPWEATLGPLLFVSHQWLGFDAPDPSNIQLHALQAALLDLQGLLKASSRDLYSGATNMTNRRRSQEMDADVDADNCWVWVDYWSIPQIRKGTTQLQAIHSIPAYVDAAVQMVVLVPDAVHSGTGILCNMSSYQKRGWCRVEQVAFALKDYIVGAGGVRMTVIDQVDGTVHPEAVTFERVAQSASRSVFNGDFTCCHYEHAMKDGTPMKCDKLAIGDVVLTLFNNALKRLKSEGDMVTYRRMKSCMWILLAGSGMAIPRATTVEEHLAAYEIPSVTAKVEGGMTALHYAAYDNNPKIVKLLVEAGADLDAVECDNMPPISMCAKTGSRSACEALLEAGADPNTLANATHEGTVYPIYGILGLSCLFSKPEDGMVKLLLASKSDLNYQIFDWHKVPGKECMDGHAWNGVTVLHCAILGGHAEHVRLLLEAGADHTVPVAAGGKYVGLTGSALAKAAQIQGLGMDGLECWYPAFAFAAQEPMQEPPMRTTTNSKCCMIL